MGLAYLHTWRWFGGVNVGIHMPYMVSAPKNIGAVQNRGVPYVQIMELPLRKSIIRKPPSPPLSSQYEPWVQCNPHE